jgi:hypothetical protein
MSLSSFSLHGKTALVTGGNGGLGRAIALGLRDAGANVIATGRNPEKNSAMSSELLDLGSFRGTRRTIDRKFRSCCQQRLRELLSGSINVYLGTPLHFPVRPGYLRGDGLFGVLCHKKSVREGFSGSKVVILWRPFVLFP